MDDLYSRLTATARKQLGATSAKIVSDADLSQYAPFVDNWSDLDICWDIVYPQVTSNDAEALKVKAELLGCVWQSCSARRGILTHYPSLRSVHNPLDLLTEVVMKIFSSDTPYPSFLGYNAFCNLVSWRMNKHVIALMRKKEIQLSSDEEISDKVADTYTSPADKLIVQEQADRLANLISRLPSDQQLLIADYNNKTPFVEMSIKYNVSEIALRKKVQRLVDHLAVAF
jgi:DNA-directed RNA polymerase specialized sigma24 family protein